MGPRSPSRGEISDIITSAGEHPGVRGIVGIRLKAGLGAMIFRPGARGKNGIGRPVVAGENHRRRGKKNERRGDRPPYGRARGGGIKSCHRLRLFYNKQVRLNWKFAPMAMFVALALCAGGCGGISASHTVSPLDFLMPGIMKNDEIGRAHV